MRNDRFRDGRRPDSARDGDHSSQRIEAEVRETRAAMDETLDQLGHRLEPSRLAGDIWGAVREHLPAGDEAASAIRSAGRDLTRRIGAHPVPAALAGLGLIWLLAEETAGDSVRVTDGESGAGAAGRTAHDAGRRVGQRAGEAAQSAAHSASRWGHDAADSVTHAAHRTADSVSHAANRAANSVVDASNRAAGATGEAYDSRPLLFGALAITAGIAAGIAIPKSRTEKRAFGETGQQIRDRAARFGRDAGRRVAGAAGESAAESVERIGDAVESEAGRAAREAEDVEQGHEGRPGV